MGRGEGEGLKVCVTGASGYIGSWIVKVLLTRGYSVNATVRTLNDPKKIDHLLALEGAKERLNLFEATLLEEGSFDSAVHGCQGVFHTASPVNVDAPNPELEIVEPAVKGTLNVLSSCAKTPTIKRVVLTSSMASVLLTGKPLNAGVTVDETWFSDPEICEQPAEQLTFMKWYMLSKTLAEKAAWNFSKENGIDLVSIIPAVVIGPWFQPTPTSSIDIIRSMIIGTETYPIIAIYGWVNIKNVADAHVLAFENPSASGRYILNESVTPFSEVIEILHELYPTLKLPNKFEDDEAVERTYKVCKQKAESLGIKYIPLKESLKETIDCLKEKDLVTF